MREKFIEKNFSPASAGKPLFVQHYIGYSEDLFIRLKFHAAGQGARIMEVLAERGIRWALVRTWDGGRKLERQLKNRHEAPRLCPICKKAKEEHRGHI